MSDKWEWNKFDCYCRCGYHWTEMSTASKNNHISICPLGCDQIRYLVNRREFVLADLKRLDDEIRKLEEIRAERRHK